MIRLRPIVLAATVLTGAATMHATEASAQIAAERGHEIVWSAPPPAMAVEFAPVDAPYPATLWTTPIQRAVIYNHPPRFAIYAIDPGFSHARIRTRRRPILLRHISRRVTCCCVTGRR